MVSEVTKKFDKMTVEYFDGRFTGTFAMPEEDGQDIDFDDVVCFLVRAVTSKSNMGSTKEGELKRTNVFSVADDEMVRMITAEQYEGFLEDLATMPADRADGSFGSEYLQ